MSIFLNKFKGPKIKPGFIVSKSFKITEKIDNSGIPFIKFIILATAINLIVIVLVILLRNNLPPEVPLFYGLPESGEQLAPKIFLIFPSIVSETIIIVNLLLSFLIKDNFIKRAVIFSSLLSTIFSSITTLKIIFLVGSF